jgi:hypothetical protein
VHHDGIRLGEGQLFGVQPIAVVILALGRDKAAVHALFLKPQHHHHIGAFQPLAHVVVKFTAEMLDSRRHQGGRRDQAQTVFHLAQQDQVGAGHAAMGDIAANRHGQALNPALGAADGQRIQQRLRRVFVPTVARVQHRAIHLRRQQVHRPRRAVPHHQQIRMHRVQCHRGVDQRLALLHRRRGDRHVHHIRTQPLSGQFETRLRAGRVLEEHVDLRQPRQHIGLFHRAPVQIDIAIRQIQNGQNFLRRKLLDPKKVAGAEGHGCLRRQRFDALIESKGCGDKSGCP